VVHLCRDTDYGCEVRTRLFVGDLDRAPPGPMRSLVLSQIVSEKQAQWTVRHQSEEFVYLSQFLPSLYAREAHRARCVAESVTHHALIG